ncbi:MAG: hypothetical protein HPKKFMNG_02323 [Planctomycetes bacterium]|nr:hypothetical protein [Planctomycetota bacterium]MCQ3951588.1 hypothetical protein [Planctomycetota bacterium]
MRYAISLLALLIAACSGGQGADSPAGSPSGPALAIVTSTLADGLVSQTYAATLQAAGGTQPYAWAVVAGALPPGMTLNGQGDLAGSPASAGSFSFTARVQDALGAQADAAFLFTVLASPPAAPMVTAISPTFGLNDRAVPITLTGTGFTGATLVQLNDAALTPLTNLVVVNSGTLTATIPAEIAPGNWTLRVTTPAGQSAPSPAYAARNMTDPEAPWAFAVGYMDATMPGASGDTPAVRIYYPATTAGQNATPSALGAPYPCVVYNHGFKPPVLAGGIDYRANTFVAHPLAGLGYVVICIDQAPNNVLFGSGATAQANSQRDADDARAAINYLASLHAGSTSPLSGLLDVSRVGVAGHSRGGDASLMAASDERAALGAAARIRAVAVMGPPSTDSQQSGAPIQFGNFTAVPALCIGATADAIAPYSQQLDIFALAGSPSAAFEINGGNHSQYKDSSTQLTGDSPATISLATQQEICRRYVVAWFNRHVKGLVVSTAPRLPGGAVYATDSRIQNRQSK